MNFVLYLLGIVVAGSAGALGGVLYVRHQPPPPRIVVLDMRSLAESVANDATLSGAARQERVAQLGASVNRLVGLYVKGGAIVLDANAVVRAPKDAYVEP